MSDEIRNQIKEISLTAKIRVKDKERLISNLTNMLNLIDQMKSVGKSTLPVYSYKSSTYRLDQPVNVIADESFNPFQNKPQVDKMFENEGAINESN